MASTEKELEGRILEVGNRLAFPPSSVDELLALLDQTESLLSRVAQSPSQSVSAALRPAMKALVAKELLEHSDMDVKVAVASCASEITRITAPDAPYDDNLMKVIFQMIVEAFGKLDDISSRSYSKRVSILETVAKVRSCVVMLDLECDAMILEMFHHFLKTISSNHPEKVFSLMETIMTLVLEESEDISSELLSCLLDSVQKDKEILPIARRLGEKVIGNCAVKLKPYLMKVVQSLCAREYSKIVASICQENSDALEQNEITISGENLADDNKLSEKTVSDELPQGSAKLEQEVGSPVKVGTVDKSSKLVVENGIIQRENGDCIVEPTPPQKKPGHSRSSGQSKNVVAADISDSDNLESMDVKSDGTLDLKPKKIRGRKANSSVQVTDGTDHSRNNSDKEVPTLPSKRKGRSKEADSSQLDGPSGNEVESAVFSEPEEKIEHEEKNDLEPRCRSDNEGPARVSSQTPGENILNATRRKRGRPSRSKVYAKSGVNTIADQSVSTSGLRSEDNDLKKEPQAVNNSEGTPLISEGKSLRRSGKKVQSENAVDGETSVSVTSDSEAKPPGDTGRKGSKKKVTLRESSREEQKSDIKQPKGKVTLEKDEAGKLILKDDPSSPKSGTKAQHKDQRRLKDGVKTQSGRKRARGTEEVISETQNHKTELDENLVGSRIRVWWPDDKRFYVGTVDKFNPISRKHKIVYDDGEIEELALKNERYEIDGHGTEIEGDKKKAVPSPNTSSKVPLNKKAKAISDSLTEQAMTETPLTRPPKKRAKTISDSSPEQATPETPLKSGTESGSGHDSLVIKRRGRPKGRPSTKLGTVSNDSAKTSSKSKEKVARKSKDDTPSKLKGPSNKSEDDSPDIGTKDHTPRIGGKPKDATPKSGSKSKDVTSKTGRKLKVGTPKMISKSRDEPLEQTPKSAGKSKSDSQKPRPKGRPRKIEGTPKSKSATPKVGRKPKSKGGAMPKTAGESSASGASEKGKTKVLESGTPARAKGSVGGAGKKRKRKGHK